jgi:hypothetical protein
MGAQVGIYSAYQLGLHNHEDASNGGILVVYSRYGAYRAPTAGATVTGAHNLTVRTRVGTLGYETIKLTNINPVNIDGFQAGTWRVSFDMKTDTAPNQVDAMAFLVHNGVWTASGVFSDITGGYVTKTWNTGAYTIYDGDQLIIQVNDPLTVGVSVRNLYLRWTWQIPYFGNGADHVLTAALALNDVDAGGMIHTDADP